MRKHLIPLAFIISSMAVAQPPPTPTPAPPPTPPEVDGLRACVALAERGQSDSAAALAATIEPLFRKRIARSKRDVEALTGLARTLSQCQLPAANFISQGMLSQEA